MKKIIVASSMLLAAQAFADSAIVDSIKNGKVSGNIRAYHIIVDKKTSVDQQAFAFGGKLHAENAPIMGFNAGLTFLGADDFGLVSKTSAKRETKYIDSTNYSGQVVALGESYLNYAGYGFNLRSGAQEVTTPFANSADAQVMPQTFKGHTLSYTGVENLKIQAAQLNKFKLRNTGTFNNTTTKNGVVLAGADYAVAPMKAGAYYYAYGDMMNLAYATGSYALPEMSSMVITPGVQYMNESATGAKTSGDVKSQVIGANLNATSGDLKIDVGYVTIKEQTGKQGNGGFYSPLTIISDPLYTNSMIHGMANTGDAGSSYKATVNYALNSDLSTKLSYAKYDYKTNTNDRTEMDFDFTYKFSSVPGLSYTNRMGMISSDTESLKQSQWRAQLQMTF